MRATRQLKIRLPVEMANFVRAKVASGDYASESEVIREGLRSLRARDAAIERWLREEVVPTLLAHEADPSRAIPIDEVFDRVIGRVPASGNPDE